MDLFFGSGPPFVNPCVFLLVSTWIHIWRGVVTVVDVQPTRRSTSSCGVVPVGLGDGVGDCHDATVLQEEGLFNFPFDLFKGVELCSFYKSVVFILVYGGNTGRKNVRPHFLPWLDEFCWLSKGPFSFSFAGCMEKTPWSWC